MRHPPTLNILAAVLLMLPASPHRPQDDTSVASRVARLANVQKNWGPKMNTPGAAITLKETHRERTQSGTAVYYRLFGSGLENDAVYTLFSTSLGLATAPALEGVTFDPSGLAVCAGKPGTCTSDRPNDPIDLAVFAAKGEPKRFAAISEDKESKAFTFVVPFPILGKDRGCTIEAILLTAKAEAVLIRGSSFAAGIEVHFTGVSEGETQQSDSKADGEGNLYVVALAYVKGKSRGKAKVTLQSAACSPSLSFEWGEGTDHNQ
jgi:hypothetical protein